MIKHVKMLSGIFSVELYLEATGRDEFLSKEKMKKQGPCNVSEIAILLFFLKEDRFKRFSDNLSL